MKGISHVGHTLNPLFTMVSIPTYCNRRFTKSRGKNAAKAGTVGFRGYPPQKRGLLKTYEVKVKISVFEQMKNLLRLRTKATTSFESKQALFYPYFPNREQNRAKQTACVRQPCRVMPHHAYCTAGER